jgi:uncharacterized membrane protein YfcA
MKTALLAGLAVFTVAYIIVWASAIVRSSQKRTAPDFRGSFIGFVTNFFDTLGIGSYAPTTSFFKLWGLVRDEQIPGTLNVGHTLPTLVEAFIFIAVVDVDLKTLILMIAGSVAGAWFGAGIVSRWPRRWIQVGMGAALLVMAGIFLLTQLKLMPGGGTDMGLLGGKLAFAVAANTMLGALMTLGIGLYGPCMILISLMGMNPKAAFPIMMGSCAFLMPVGSTRFIRGERYNLKSALGLTLGGIPGVLIAAYIVKEMPLDVVRWLVIVVVVYTAAMMLRSAAKERRAAAAATASV